MAPHGFVFCGDSKRLGLLSLSLSPSQGGGLAQARLLSSRPRTVVKLGVGPYESASLPAPYGINSVSPSPTPLTLAS
ncbi:hypothetical protein LY76DRAFT_589507 [Colletotrichum caudatum]|nr:hypothetical protein LY76DRAFT_589507 [Colletotrichum caudatum]